MAWKRKPTSITVDAEVDLNSFSDAQLLQALIYSGLLTEDEAEAILRRASDKSTTKPAVLSSTSFDQDYLEDARRAAWCGRKDEALHYIEHFLGREWIGRLQ